MLEETWRYRSLPLEKVRKGGGRISALLLSLEGAVSVRGPLLYFLSRRRLGLG